MGNQNYQGRSLDTFVLKYLPQLTMKHNLSDAQLQKTILCTIEDEGPVVCKFHFQKNETEGFGHIENEVNKIRNMFSIYKHPNVLVYEKVFNFQKKTLMGMRQFVCHNLKEKLHRIPKLSLTEKKWLVFQLLCAVSQIHQEKSVHGDIKPDNIVMTSYNWLFITDQAPYKPSFLREDDLKLYNLFFGELDNNQRCYLAPERFRVEWDESLKDPKLMEPSMDVFSAGCVIAEIFMDGIPLFDLAHLQNYRKGLYDPQPDLQKRIKDAKIVKLIMSMIERDPYQRQPINSYILQWNNDVFPRCFSQVYFQIGSAYLRPQFLYADQKISVIRKYIDSIWFACFGKVNAVVTEEFREPIEPNIFEKIREDTIEQYKPYLVPSNELFQFLNIQNLRIAQETEPDYKPSDDDKEGIIVIVHWIGSFIHSCFFPQSKICALEMLYKIGINSSIEMRLQFILPYILTMFEDESSKVKAKAIEVAVMIFSDVLDQGYVTTLTATDYKVFDNYILPAFLKLKNESTKDQFVQHVFVRYLPMLALIGHRFLELSVGSRFQKRQQQQKISQGHQQEVDDQDIVEEIDSERLFQHNDNLLQVSTHHQPRQTIIIKDDMLTSQRPQRLQDAMEVFVNYDTEYDKLRRIILSLINDILNETEPSLQRILFENLGVLGVFFGRKMTVDNLIPLSNSCFNKKDFMLRMECLRGIPFLGLRVGSQTLAQYLLITCTQLLYDSEENVVFEMIKALTRLLEFRLMSKEDSMENLDKLLPFLMHPNTWIRNETIRYVNFMADPENQILSKAEAYCLLRPKLKQYLKKHEKVFKAPKETLADTKLKSPLSREIYDYEVKGTPIKKERYVAGEQLQLSDSDQAAKGILKEVLDYARAYYHNFKRDKVQKDLELSYIEDFRRKREKIKTYRILTIQTLAQLAGLPNYNTILSPQRKIFKNQLDPNDGEFSQLDINNGIKQSKLNGEAQNNITSSQYANLNFYPVSQVAPNDIQDSNYGLNQRILNNIHPINFETDMILQALNLVPEDPNLPLVGYKNQQLFQNVAIQSIQVGSILQLEQSSEQPVTMPQFNQGAKVAQIQVSAAGAAQHTLGALNHHFLNWRPTGRLITTLYEHKNPVNCFAVTDDSQYFFTASGRDQIVNIWSTYDIERDITSHSQFTIKNKRNIRAMTVMQNSTYFAVAGSQGGVDIFQMSRLEQEQSLISEKLNTTASSYKNPYLERQSSSQAQSDPNYTAIIKTLEKKDEGDITHCLNMILPIQQQHLLSYITQRGSLYFHDLRSRFDVQDQFELFGCQRGLPTSMTVGQDPYQLYFGTLGGYVVIYDIRYGLVSQYYKHYLRAPITSIASFCPSRTTQLNLNRSISSSPMALISAGTSNYEVSLVNLQTNDVEILLTVDDSKNKDGGAQSIPTIPTYYKESLFDTSSGQIRKNETTSSLFGRYLQSNRHSQHFNTLVGLKEQQLLKNIDEEWIKHSKNRYMLVKTGYESSNACTKILVPRRFNSLLHNSETVSYAITGGNDKKIRYWDFNAPSTKSYYLNTPNDDECQYYGEYLGDTFVVQERVNQFKQFPPYKMDCGTLSDMMATPDAYLQDGLHAGLTGNVMGPNTLRTGSVTNSNPNDPNNATSNFNGLAEWQRFNGLALNQGCGGSGAAETSNSVISTEYMYRDSQSVSHQDCILDMGMIELQNQDPILVTCGRDNLVKLWR